MRNLFILRGAPGCGKSTWVKQNNLEPYTLSSDVIRLMYQSPITNKDGQLVISQNNDSSVWKLFMELLERRMSNGEFVILDATHYKSSLISRYKDLITKYRYRVNIVNFDISKEECLKRNKQRESYKFVPEDVIDKMYACLNDDSEIKKAYKIITPEEALDIINTPLQPFVIPENIEKVIVIGDIHGCYTVLKQYFDENPFNDNTNYIFCGDYIDRGTKNKETLEFLFSLKNKKNCIFLDGNHEKWLRIFAQKDYDMDFYENQNKEYKDIYVVKILAQLKDKLVSLQKQTDKLRLKAEELSRLLINSRQADPTNKIVYYHFQEINVPEEKANITKQIKINSDNMYRLQTVIDVLQHEEHSTKAFIDSARSWFLEQFDNELSLNIINLLEKNYNVTANKRDNPIKSFEFIKRTYPQIKDIDKVELRRFCDRLAQMSFFEFAGSKYLVTHGGVPSMPNIKTQTKELIKGVGNYEDSEIIDKAFIENTNGKICQIHAHRNIMRVPICVEKGLTYNLEGQVEFGGCLRILELDKDGGIKEIELQNTDFIPTDEPIKEEKTDFQILNDMYESKLIQVKELEDNIISLNFTRDAFQKSQWNDLTCTARGLFVDKTNGNIAARSFNKFFNYQQYKCTESASLKQNFAYPIFGYKKENGFLGIISKYKGKARIFSKSTDSGDYVNYFIGALCNNYDIKLQNNINLGNNNIFTNDITYTNIYNRLQDKESYENKESYADILISLKNQLINKLTPLIKEGYSYVFECIDPVNDPHIIKYNDTNVCLLEVFKNQLKEEHVDWKTLNAIADRLTVPCKEQLLRFNNWEEFEQWKNKFRHDITQWECKHEGYVLEDADNFRVKFKSSFYSYWKQMRTLKDIIQKGGTNKKIYKTKQEIQVVKLLESIPKEKLKNLNIIDIQDMYYKQYPQIEEDILSR